MASSSRTRTDMDELQTLLSKQHLEVVSAQIVESDLNFAFELQMKEAMSASLALQPSSSTSIPPTYVREDDKGCLSFTALVAKELDSLEQECKDRKMVEAEMRRMKEDLNLRIHDRKVASDIMRIPVDEWEKDGDNYEKPYGKGKGGMVVAEDESFNVYVKGLVSEERVKDSTVIVAAIGVAICDSNDNLIFELRKPLVDGEDKSLMSGVEVGIKALTEGLDAAIALDLKSVSCFCDDYVVQQYIMSKLPPSSGPWKIYKLVHDAMQLKSKFARFTVSFVARNDIKFAFEFARDAIVSQITWPAETSRGKKLLMETCIICFEDTVVRKMFSVNGCLHRFCLSCMKRHVEVKLLNGAVAATCPHQGCQWEVRIESWIQFLDPKSIDKMRQRKKEASIPVTEKVYCPYPKCSMLMSKTEVLEYTGKLYDGGLPPDGVRKCTKCHHFFCINCKVPWHYDSTCDDFKRSNNYQSAEDAILKSLAAKNLWRQCAKCNHMIELAQGCYHIYCSCGFEFCYTCGAEWKNKKATCTCPLWFEPNILYNDRRRRR